MNARKEALCRLAKRGAISLQEFERRYYRRERRTARLGLVAVILAGFVGGMVFLSWWNTQIDQQYRQNWVDGQNQAMGLEP